MDPSMVVVHQSLLVKLKELLFQQSIQHHNTTRRLHEQIAALQHTNQYQQQLLSSLLNNQIGSNNKINNNNNNNFKPHLPVDSVPGEHQGDFETQQINLTLRELLRLVEFQIEHLQQIEHEMTNQTTLLSSLTVAQNVYDHKTQTNLLQSAISSTQYNQRLPNWIAPSDYESNHKKRKTMQHSSKDEISDISKPNDDNEVIFDDGDDITESIYTVNSINNPYEVNGTQQHQQQYKIMLHQVQHVLDRLHAIYSTIDHSSTHHIREHDILLIKHIIQLIFGCLLSSSHNPLFSYKDQNEQFNCLFNHNNDSYGTLQEVVNGVDNLQFIILRLNQLFHAQYDGYNLLGNIVISLCNLPSFILIPLTVCEEVLHNVFIYVKQFSKSESNGNNNGYQQQQEEDHENFNNDNNIDDQQQTSLILSPQQQGVNNNIIDDVDDLDEVTLGFNSHIGNINNTRNYNNTYSSSNNGFSIQTTKSFTNHSNSITYYSNELNKAAETTILIILDSILTCVMKQITPLLTQQYQIQRTPLLDITLEHTTSRDVAVKTLLSSHDPTKMTTVAAFYNLYTHIQPILPNNSHINNINTSSSSLSSSSLHILPGYNTKKDNVLLINEADQLTFLSFEKIQKVDEFVMYIITTILTIMFPLQHRYDPVVLQKLNLFQHIVYHLLTFKQSFVQIFVIPSSSSSLISSSSHTKPHTSLVKTTNDPLSSLYELYLDC